MTVTMTVPVILTVIVTMIMTDRDSDSDVRQDCNIFLSGSGKASPARHGLCQHLA